MTWSCKIYRLRLIINYCFCIYFFDYSSALARLSFGSGGGLSAPESRDGRRSES